MTEHKKYRTPRLYEYRGEQMPLGRIARLSGINTGTLYGRVVERGMSVDDALFPAWVALARRHCERHITGCEVACRCFGMRAPLPTANESAKAKWSEQVQKLVAGYGFEYHGTDYETNSIRVRLPDAVYWARREALAAKRVEPG